MPDDWSPRFVSKERAKEPMIVGESGPEIVNLPRVVKAEAAPKVRGWRFVPERDANNLIVEIIATPITE